MSRTHCCDTSKITCPSMQKMILTSIRSKELFQNEIDDPQVYLHYCLIIRSAQVLVHRCTFARSIKLTQIAQPYQDITCLNPLRNNMNSKVA